MPNPNISAALSVADKASIITSVNGISLLLPFLGNLSPEQRHDLRKVATKREGLVISTYTASLNNPTAIPVSFSMGEWTKDELLNTNLKDIRDAMAMLVEGIDDTILALGSERIAQAETALGFLTAAAKGNAALTAVVENIRTAYAGQGTQAPLPVITVPAAGKVSLEGVVIGKRLLNKGDTILAINKAGSVNAATIINVDPGTGVVIPQGYKNIDVTNLSPSAAGSFSVKTK